MGSHVVMGGLGRAKHVVPVVVAVGLGRARHVAASGLRRIRIGRRQHGA